MRVNSILVEILSLDRPVQVRELTVADIRAFLLTGESGVSARDLCLLTDLLPELVARLSEAEARRLIEACLDINAAFFSGDSRGELHSPASPDAREQDAPATLEKAVARMVRIGHVNAWDYPWAVFKAAVEEVESAK
jgi:hypothetical protein